MKSRIRNLISKCIRRSAYLCLALPLLAPPPAIAADAAEDAPTLHVLRPIINSEKAKAEICLEFDHQIVAQEGANRSPASVSLKLESEDRKQTFSARAAAYSGNELCVPGLTHRTTYRLKLGAFKSPSNGKLGSPYSLSFTVPARRPSLTFVGDNSGATVSRWRENPVLRSMNVGEAKLELFRIKDPARMAEAWSLRAQTALAPSETATFAHAHGELVWQGAQSFEDKPDEGNEKQIPLPANAEAGLYLAVASAPNLITKKTELVPISALWLLRSDLKVKLLQIDSGFYAMAFSDKAEQTPEKATITAYNPDFKKIAEMATDPSGIAFIPKPAAYANKRNREPFSGTVMAVNERGQIGFADLNENVSKSSAYTMPSSETALLVTRGAYAPGALAEAQLAAQDLHGKGITISNSYLQIAKKNGKVYATHQVKETTGGKARISFPAPMTEGIWTLAWKQNDGSELAKGILKVTSVANAPQLEMAADRGRLTPDGELTLTIRSLTPLKTASPMTQGKVRIDWKRTENIFPAWNGYVFGAGANNEHEEGRFLTATGATRKTLPFITDEKGLARISARIAPPQNSEENGATESSLWIATISVESEQGSGAFDPPALDLPLKPSHASIGIKALSAQARFPENGMARFDVVALDGDGNRIDADNLVYRVYEEGRRFDWYPNAGKWDYKPVPQRARIEGGQIFMKGESRSGARLEIPVTSGTYRLEIADAEGQILAQTPFSAGWGTSDAEATSILPLPFKLVPSTLRPGAEAKIQLKLDRPALLKLIIADDRIRKVFQEAKPKGNVEIAFTPSGEWAKKLKITLEAETPGLSNAIYRGQIETKPATATQPFTKKEIEESTSATLAAQSVKSGLQATQGAENPRPGNALAPSMPREAVALSSSDRITLAPQKEWSPTEQETGHAGAQAQGAKSLAPANRKRRNAKEEQNLGKAGAVAFVAPAPMMNLPTILSYIMDRPAYTLSELAGSLQTSLKWKDALTESGIISEPLLAERIRNETSRILNRQLEDGGFSAMPGGESDMVSTTTALSVLSAQATPALAPAITHAEEWLSRRLENAWYADRERPERALAYGALARAGKTDVSNLRYFADTSIDKELPPLACANIALAFAQNNDKSQAQVWIDKTKASIAREKEVDAAVKGPEAMRGKQQEGDKELVSPSTLTDANTRPDIVAAWRALAENRFANAESVLSEINKMAEAVFASTSRKRGLDIMNDLAWGMKDSLDRTEPWRAAIRGADKRVNKGVLVVLLPQTATDAATSKMPPVIRNASNRTLAIEFAQWGRRPAARANMSRKILTLDGAPAKGELRANNVYVIVDEGQWPENEADGLLVVDVPGPMLAPQTCAVRPASGYGFLGWLKEGNLTSEQDCERAPDGIYVRLASPQKESSDQTTRYPASWRIAWLARPRAKGSEFLSPPKLRALFPGARTYEGPGEKINVR